MCILGSYSGNTISDRENNLKLCISQSSSIRRCKHKPKSFLFANYNRVSEEAILALLFLKESKPAVGIKIKQKNPPKMKLKPNKQNPSKYLPPPRKDLSEVIDLITWFELTWGSKERTNTRNSGRLKEHLLLVRQPLAAAWHWVRLRSGCAKLWFPWRPEYFWGLEVNVIPVWYYRMCISKMLKWNLYSTVIPKL